MRKVSLDYGRCDCGADGKSIEDHTVQRAAQVGKANTQDCEATSRVATIWNISTKKKGIQLV